MRWKLKRYALFVLTWLFSSQLTGQTQSFQLWNDAVLNKPLSSQWVWENTLTYRTNANGSDKWRLFQGQTTFIFRASRLLEFQGYLLVNYTDQTTTYNTMEIRPGLGIRYFAIRNPRFRLGGLLRYESRSIYTFDSAFWTHDDRFRFRLETALVLKGNGFQEKGAIYGLTDAEVFYTVDHEVDERYASRVRLRIGAGFAFSSTFRLEMMYMYQFSRNSIQKAFVSTQQQVIWLRALFAL